MNITTNLLNLQALIINNFKESENNITFFVSTAPSPQICPHRLTTLTGIINLKTYENGFSSFRTKIPIRWQPDGNDSVKIYSTFLFLHTTTFDIEPFLPSGRHAVHVPPIIARAFGARLAVEIRRRLVQTLVVFRYRNLCPVLCAAAIIHTFQLFIFIPLVFPKHPFADAYEGFGEYYRL